MKPQGRAGILRYGPMHRRHWISQLTLASAAALLPSPAAPAGQFTGKIRKSLKWSMAQKAASGMSLTEAFKKLRDCGYEGVEPSLIGDHLSDIAAWTQASRDSGLIIDGTVGGRLGSLEPGLEKTQALGAESMLVVVSYEKGQSLLAQWQRSRDQLKAASAQAEKLGVKILLENVWASFFTSPFDLARFVDEIGSPWVQVHFDIGNMVRWGVPEHWAEVLGKRSQKLDVKEYDLEKAMKQGIAKGFDAPLGEGSIDWPAVRAELAKIHYTGWAAAEVKAGDWDYLTDVAQRMTKVLDL